MEGFFRPTPNGPIQRAAANWDHYPKKVFKWADVADYMATG